MITAKDAGQSKVYVGVKKLLLDGSVGACNFCRLVKETAIATTAKSFVFNIAKGNLLGNTPAKESCWIFAVHKADGDRHQQARKVLAVCALAR